MGVEGLHETVEAQQDKVAPAAFGASATWKLLCIAFLVISCCLIRDNNVLPKEELHRSLQLVLLGCPDYRPLDVSLKPQRESLACTVHCMQQLPEPVNDLILSGSQYICDPGGFIMDQKGVARGQLQTADMVARH